MEEIGHFLALERRVWDALVRGDAAADAGLLAPDFLGVYATGFAGRGDHCGQLADGPTVARYRIGQARLLPLGPARALLAYRAEYTRVGARDSEAMYVSSIWERRGDQWLNVFSQDSAESDAAPV